MEALRFGGSDAFWSGIRLFFDSHWNLAFLIIVSVMLGEELPREPILPRFGSVL